MYERRFRTWASSTQAATPRVALNRIFFHGLAGEYETRAGIRTDPGSAGSRPRAASRSSPRTRPAACCPSSFRQSRLNRSFCDASSNSVTISPSLMPAPRSALVNTRRGPTRRARRQIPFEGLQQCEIGSFLGKHVALEFARDRRSSSRRADGGRTLGLSVDWKQHYTTIGPKAQTASPARLPAQLRPRRGLPPGVPHPVGRHLPDRGRAGRARGPGLRRRLPPRRLPPAAGRRPGLHRDHPPRADPGGRRADRAPRRRALPGPVRQDRDLAGVRRGDPGLRAPSRRARQGRRHRDVLHVRRPHRRDLVARAAAAGAHRHRPRRPAAPRDAGVARRRAGGCGVRRAGGEDHLQRARGDGRGAARVRRPRRRAEADPADDELLREGRQAAGDRLHPPVVHQERRPGHRAARRAGRARLRDPVGARRT